MKSVFVLSNGKRIDLNDPNCFYQLTKEEFSELLKLVREQNKEAEAA